MYPTPFLREIFKSTSASEAQKLCRPHPQDHQILITQDIRGIKMFDSPFVKAVRWKKSSPRRMAEAFGKLGGMTFKTHFQTDRVYAKDHWTAPLLVFRREGDLPKELKREMEFLLSLSDALVFKQGRDPGVDLTGCGCTNKHEKNSPHIHAGDTVEEAIIHSGSKIFLGHLTRRQYDDMLLSQTPPQHLSSETLEPGEVIISKGLNSNLIVSVDCVPGLVYAAPAQKSPRADRLAVSVYRS